MRLFTRLCSCFVSLRRVSDGSLPYLFACVSTVVFLAMSGTSVSALEQQGPRKSADVLTEVLGYDGTWRESRTDATPPPTPMTIAVGSSRQRRSRTITLTAWWKSLHRHEGLRPPRERDQHRLPVRLSS